MVKIEAFVNLTMLLQFRRYPRLINNRFCSRCDQPVAFGIYHIIKLTIINLGTMIAVLVSEKVARLSVDVCFCGIGEWSVIAFATLMSELQLCA